MRYEFLTIFVLIPQHRLTQRTCGMIIPARIV